MRGACSRFSIKYVCHEFAFSDFFSTARAGRQTKRSEDFHRRFHLFSGRCLCVFQRGNLAQATEFLKSRFVIGQEVDLAHRMDRSSKPRDGFQLGRIVIDAGDDRYANPDPIMHPVQRLEVFQNRRIGNAGILAVFGIVHQFQVEQKQVGQWDHGQQMLLRSETAGVHCRVQSVRLAGLQKGPQKLGLHQRFASGKRHTARGIFVEHPVLHHLAHHFVDRHFPAHGLAGTGRAGLHASTAQIALLGSQGQGTVAGDGVCMRASLAALTADQATVLYENHFAFGRASFGIMTPGAAQRATFEKNRGADAGAILHRELLDIKYCAALHIGDGVVSLAALLEFGHAKPLTTGYDLYNRIQAIGVQIGDMQRNRQIVERGPLLGRPAAWFGSLVGLLGVVLASAPVQAATLTAQLDRNMVPLGESVTLSLIFEGGAPAGSPNLPALPGMRVHPGGGPIRQIEDINGQRSDKTIFNYVLEPTQVGNLVIPPLQIRVGNQVLTSQALPLQVVQGNAQNSVTNQAFLRLIVPQRQVYVGQSFPVEMQLYVRNVTDVNRPQLEAEGFSFSPMTQGRQTRAQVGGQVYNVVVFKLAATPAKAGKIKFGPATCDLTLLIAMGGRRSPSPFDAFGGFFGNPNVRRQRTTLQSETIPLDVLPLPSAKVPATFNGAVGTFRLSVTASPKEVGVGDPITVHAQISGSGPIESLSLPSQPAWKEFKIYPPTSETQTSDELGLSGAKTFTQVLIPQNHEIKSIPPLQFSFFDPQARHYRTLSGPAIPITVNAGATPAAPPPMLATNSQPNTPPPADDILPVDTHFDHSGMPTPLLAQQSWFLGVQSLPVLAWLSVLFWRKRNEALANNPRLRRQRQVAVRIREGLKVLRAQAAAGQSEEFFATLFRLLQEQLGERLDLPASAITEAVIDDHLRERGLPEETLTTLHELFQSCNLVRYAPTQSSQELEAHIPQLETTLRSLQAWKA